MTVDVDVVTDAPVGEWHRHTWHAHAGDDRWRCACGAWAPVLLRANKTVIALPPAAAA